jgi:ssDNA thymidine ADP-ribosyltransferase, DarT
VTVPRPTLIYHITPIDNLPRILADGCLLTCATLRNRGSDYSGIAFEHIQDRRVGTVVPCGLGGNLHDYVPFYFAPRSPMLYTINRGNVPGHVGDQGRIVHLVSSVQAIHRAGRKYVFTDGHATMALTNFYDDPKHLARIDWPVMTYTFWNDTIEQPDRKRRRQAEFLVHEFVEFQHIKQIGVYTARVEGIVNQMLKNISSNLEVKCRPSWYY